MAKIIVGHAKIFVERPKTLLDVRQNFVSQKIFITPFKDFTKTQEVDTLTLLSNMREYVGTSLCTKLHKEDTISKTYTDVHALLGTTIDIYVFLD